MEMTDQAAELKAALPVCDWVYFATTAKECWTVTKDFVSEAKIIFAHVYNKQRIRMPNVQHLEPGEKILLVHGGGGRPYHALFCCTIGAAERPVQNTDLRHTFPVFAYVDESLNERLYATGYDVDPVLKKFTGITIAELQDVRHITCSIQKPLGNNTLRRWDEVFRLGRVAENL
jgi:hypothetical protein